MNAVACISSVACLVACFPRQQALLLISLQTQTVIASHSRHSRCSLPTLIMKVNKFRHSKPPTGRIGQIFHNIRPGASETAVIRSSTKQNFRFISGGVHTQQQQPQNTNHTRIDRRATRSEREKKEIPCKSNRKKLHIYIYLHTPSSPRHLDSVNSSLAVLGSGGLSPSLSPELGVNSDVLELLDVYRKPKKPYFLPSIENTYVLVVLDLVPRPPVRRSVPDNLRALYKGSAKCPLAFLFIFLCIVDIPGRASRDRQWHQHKRDRRY